MASKPSSTKWDNDAHVALLVVILDIVAEDGAFSVSAHKDAIIDAMKRHGFDFSWEAIR
jgi:hypothetical protein